MLSRFSHKVFRLIFPFHFSIANAWTKSFAKHAQPDRQDLDLWESLTILTLQSADTYNPTFKKTDTKNHRTWKSYNISLLISWDGLHICHHSIRSEDRNGTGIWDAEVFRYAQLANRTHLTRILPTPNEVCQMTRVRSGHAWSIHRRGRHRVAIRIKNDAVNRWALSLSFYPTKAMDANQAISYRL